MGTDGITINHATDGAAGGGAERLLAGAAGRWADISAAVGGAALKGVLKTAGRDRDAPVISQRAGKARARVPTPLSSSRAAALRLSPRYQRWEVTTRLGKA